MTPLPTASALEAYQRLDPAGWVAVYTKLPWYGGIAAITAGVVMLLIGNGKLFRLVAGPIGAMVALMWAPMLAVKMGFAPSAQQITTVSAIALGVLGLLFPPGALFFVCGAPGGLIAGELVGGSDWMIGFLPGFLVAGALGASAHRIIGAVASSVAGGWLIVLGLLAALTPFGTLSVSLAGEPLGCIAAGGLFAVGGVIFQLFVRLSPEERARLNDQKRQAKKRRTDQKAAEARWAGISKSKGLDT